MNLESVLREQSQSDPGVLDDWEIRQNAAILSVRAATRDTHDSREEAEQAAVELLRALAQSEPDLVLVNRAEIAAVLAPRDVAGWRGRLNVVFARQRQVDEGGYVEIPLP